MRNSILIAFAALFCQNISGQNLKIELVNKTGFDIDSLAISCKYIGLLKKDSSITLECEKISIQSGMILLFPTGFIKGKKSERQILQCGTGITSVSDGNYVFDIGMIENIAGFQLYNKRQVYKE